MRIHVSAALLFLILGGCFGKKAEVKPAAVGAETTPVSAAGAQAPQNPSAKTASKPAPPPRDPNLLLITKVALQADQVQREAWRVVANEKRGPLRSAFGKLQRAALMSLDERLSSKGMFECDRYFHRVLAGEKWTASFFEKCSDKAAEKELATWLTIGPDRARVTFDPQNLREVLGTGASIFGKKMSCELRWGENQVLEELSCPGWEQDRGSQLVRLETFRYRRNQGQLLSLKGKVLENLTPVRKIESEVPLEGKITVTETELNPPRPEPPKPVPPGGVAPMRKPVDPNAGKGPAPLDPDLPKDPNAPPTNQLAPPVLGTDQGAPIGIQRAKPGVPPGVVPGMTQEQQLQIMMQNQMRQEQQQEMQNAQPTPEELMQMGIVPPGMMPPGMAPPGMMAVPIPPQQPSEMPFAPDFQPGPPMPPIAPAAEPDYIPAEPNR